MDSFSDSKSYEKIPPAIYSVPQTPESPSQNGKCEEIIALIISGIFIICTFPLSLIFCFKVIQVYERGVIMRLGRLKKAGTVGPGLFFIVPCIDDVSF